MAFLAGPSRRDEGGRAVPTYRHLLSPQAMTVFNPLRTIAHCDIDAAYAQFEQVRLGLPDDTPLICAQWTSIIAVNYPARKWGIKRFGMDTAAAKKICPPLVVQHVATYRNGESEAGYWGEVDPKTHKVSLDPYRRESLKILAIFREIVPRGEIEKASIDEAFLDLTPVVIERLLKYHPYLATIPSDAPEGLDTPLPPPPPIDWSKSGNVFPVNGEKEDQQPDDSHPEDLMASQGGFSEDGQVNSGSSKATDSWEDWALCVGAEVMAETRAEVWKRLHYTCSAGIAHNKALAKLCSSWKKPNNQTVLRLAATPAFLRNMAFTDIRFLGGKLGSAIASEYGAKTVGDMLSVSLDEMQSRFGEESIWVYNILRGIDHTEVIDRTATKSMLASKNVRPNVTTPEQGVHWLNVLAGELNVRLRDAREITPGLWPKTLVLSHRTGVEPSRSRQTPFPFTRHLSTEYIVKYARKLWDEVTQPMKYGNMKLNNMALSFTGLEKLEEGQQGIENFFSAPAAAAGVSGVAAGAKRSRSSTPVAGTIAKTSTNSNTSQIVTGPSPKKPRLPTLHTIKRKTALDTFLAKNANGSSSTSTISHNNLQLQPQPQLGPQTLSSDDDIQEIIDPQFDVNIDEDKPILSKASGKEVWKWKCPKCHSLFTPSPNASDPQVDLASKKLEHEDYHFALSLQSGGSPESLRSQSATGAEAGGKGNVKKKTKKAEGIKAFFTSGSGTKPK